MLVLLPSSAVRKQDAVHSSPPLLYLQPPLHDVSSLINSDPHVDPVTIALGSDTKNAVADGKMGIAGKGKGVSMDSEDNMTPEETRKVCNTF